MWWSASLITIPLQLFIVGTLFAVLRYVRDPSGRRLAVLGAIVFGLVALLALVYVSSPSPELMARFGRVYASVLQLQFSADLFVFAGPEQVLLMARIDNLGKGASGAAVQTMNLVLGLPEGLSLQD